MPKRQVEIADIRSRKAPRKDCVMELHVFARSREFDEHEEFDSQMKCFIREEYGHILGGHVAVLEGARGLERFMAKYWGGLSDDEIDEDAETEMWVVARAATSGAARRAA